MTVHLHRFHPYLNEHPEHESPTREPRSYTSSSSKESSLQVSSTSAFQPVKKNKTFTALKTEPFQQKKPTPLKALTGGLMMTFAAANQIYFRNERMKHYVKGLPPKFESVQYTYTPLTLLSTEGFTSTVYKTADRGSGEAVAVKYFKEFVSLSHVHKEADLMRRFQHVPHAPSLKAEYSDALVTKLIDCPNLYRRMYTLNLQQISSIGLQFFEFLSCMEKMGYITGDFKTDNILYFYPENQLTFVDIGTAFLSSTAQDGHVQASSYRAPEARLGMNRYTSALDIWSAGCVLYELFTRESLFGCSNEGTEEESNLYLLHTTEAHLGKPPLEWLKAGTKTHLYYQSHQHHTRRKYEHATLKAAPADFQPVTPWKTRMRQQAADVGNRPSQVEALIDLIDRCIRYTGRISARTALNHPFFQGHVHLKLEFDVSSLNPYFVYIMNAHNVSISKLTLSSLPRCIHLLPSEGNSYTFSLANSQKKVFGNATLTLKKRSVVHIKPNGREWTFETSS